MSEHFRRNRAVIIFSVAWFILNLIQSYFTEIIDDEAYYWLYSRFMAWGYFDHPPMVALLIRMGYGIFPNELGIRLFYSLLGAGTIYLVWLMIPEKSREARIYLPVVFAISLMHLNAAGFTALPDIPLVFFTSLYFLLLKKYFRDDRFSTAILLGVVVALMMYSKYHTLLILFLTLVSNLKLILRKSFWIVVATAILLYMPHIIWQVDHDFVSFRYHLIGRNKLFQPGQILEYLGNQVLVTGPFVGLILFYLALARKSGDSWERMLKFNLVGFFGFFLVTTLRGHVEPHWTAAAFPPLIVLALMHREKFPRLDKWLKILAYASIPVIITLRIYLVWNFVPLPGKKDMLFHEKDTWARQIEEVAGDRPVVFMNKFQYPAVYWYYTGKKAFTRNNVYYRRNQFDIWPLEEELEGKPVILIRWKAKDSTHVLPTVRLDHYYYEIEKYCSFNRLNIDFQEKIPVLKAGQDYQVPIRISNPTDRTVNLDCDCDLPPKLMYCYAEYKVPGLRYYFVEPQPAIGSLGPGQEIKLELTLKAPANPGNYKLMVAFGSRILAPGINGPPARLKVQP